MPNLWTTLTKELTPAQGRWILASLAAVVLLLATLFGPTNGTSPPFENSAASASPSTADIGETVNIARGIQSNGNEGFWPCGSTREAFDEMMKLAGRRDDPEVKIAMRRTHSIGLVGGMQVKILDTEFGKRKVRVLTNDAGEAYLKDEQGVFPADPRIGTECWVASEALAR
jgi:hypothetical protein